MTDSGRIDIEIDWDGARVTRVRVASTRPLAACVLIGRPVAQAVELVPMLFSLCGRAQGLCARAATASGEPAATQLDDMLSALAAEMAFEHLWRIRIDWPALLGLPVDRTPLARAGAVLRRCATRADADAAADALAEALVPIHGAHADALLAALRGVEQRSGAESACAARSLPQLPLAELRTRLPAALDAAFAQLPTCDGAPAETGAFVALADDARVTACRDAGYPVTARLAARLAALDECLAVLRGERPRQHWVDRLALGPGDALARVETARGQLMHRVRVEDGLIADYAIVAPTEWNFHPRGALAQALEGRVCADEAMLRRHAEALVLALDPCVERRLAIHRVG